jgi:hypothetical protein
MPRVESASSFSGIGSTGIRSTPPAMPAGSNRGRPASTAAAFHCACTAPLNTEASAISGDVAAPAARAHAGSAPGTNGSSSWSHAGGAAANKSLHTSLSGPGAPVLGRTSRSRARVAAT